jgi:hypothetical protein
MIINNGTAHKLSGSDEDSELILIDEEKAFDRAAAHVICKHKANSKYRLLPYLALSRASAIRHFYGQSIIDDYHICSSVGMDNS